MVDAGSYSKKRDKNKRLAIVQLLLLTAIIIVVNVLSSGFFKRLDLTDEGRFSISQPNKEMLRSLDDIVYIKIFLSGDLTPNLKQLQQAVREMLEEFKVFAGANLEFEFVDPFEIEDENEMAKYIRQLEDQGVFSVPFSSSDKEQISQGFLFPFVLISYQEKERSVLLTDYLTALNQVYDPSNAISKLEYKLSRAITGLTIKKRPLVAFVSGHGELDTIDVADISADLNDMYDLSTLNLRQANTINEDVDVLIIAKPRFEIPGPDKFKIDQYLMRGGKLIWLIDPLIADFDSLRKGGAFVTLPYGLNIDDQLLQYGVRVNEDLIQDRQSTHINVPYGDGFVPRPWPYNPVITNFNQLSLISRNLDAIETKFVSSIDTVLSPGVKKTFLLRTSESSRIIRAGAQISFKIVQFPPDEDQYDKPELPVSVLLQGEFESAFARRRLLADELIKLGIGGDSFVEKSTETSMIVISDGDMIRNYVDADGNVYPLGLNNIERYVFSNKDFLLNCIDFLAGNTGIIEPRSKKLRLRPLDAAKVSEERLNWQLINLLAPLIFLYLFSGVYNFIRIRKYSSKP